MPPPRQTLSYLRNLFERRGIAPRRQLGQNFLIDLNIHELIAREADLGPTDVVLEVGPGAGALTTLMAEKASAVVAVELDPAMAELTGEATAPYPNVRVLQMDALKGKNRLNPELVDNIRSGLAVAPDRTLKLVANLPYNIATPLVSNLLVHPELCPALMVVTIQHELAERMLAEPATAHYGGLSVMMHALADVELVRALSPKVFWPRPHVDSAIIKITPNADKRAAIPDLAWFHHVVRRVFLHRRKNLRARAVQRVAEPVAGQVGGRRPARRPGPGRDGHHPRRDDGRRRVPRPRRGPPPPPPAGGRRGRHRHPGKRGVNPGMGVA